MDIRNIGNNLQVAENQTINFNKDVVLTLTTDNGEQSVLICKLYCTIITNKSIQYYMDVVDKTLFQNNKATIQPIIDEFKASATRLAEENNVPIV